MEKFFVREDGSESMLISQTFGISQGCPLSQFLFVLTMSMLMHDATRRVQDKCGET